VADKLQLEKDNTEGKAENVLQADYQKIIAD
jgi:hypothetical protein